MEKATALLRKETDMTVAILLSDNELLNDIYSVNLSAYLDLNVIIESSFEDIEKHLALEDVKIAITLSTINGEDAGPRMFNLFEPSNIPLIIIGEKSSISNTPDVLTVPGNLNIQFFLRNVAKILGITAKEMADKAVGDYFPMGIKAFLGLDIAPCDIFYKVSRPGEENEFTKVWSDRQIIGDKFEKFKDLNVLSLFVPADKRLIVTNLITKSISSRITNKSLSNTEKLEAVESGFELTVQSLFTNETTAEEVQEISSQCVDAIYDVMKSSPGLSEILKSLVSNKSRFIYMHSILVTFVGQHILSKIPWGSKEHIEKVTYVLFFHDMFLVSIYNDHPDIKYEEDLIFSPDLTDSEKDVIINHARDAGSALKMLPKTPIGADTIITQHHGATNGVGFNMNPGNDVSPLAKVIIIAEAFVDEFLKSKEEGNSPDLNIINGELLERFSNKSYQKIINTLLDLKI